MDVHLETEFYKYFHKTSKVTFLKVLQWSLTRLIIHFPAFR